MSIEIKVYDADQVNVVVAGIPIAGGFPDGEFLRIEADSDDFTDIVGAVGDVTRSKTNDRRATATLILMQSSASNNLLSALSNLDRKVGGGAGIGPFLVRDKQGTALYTASKCWVARPPDISFGKEAGPREWKIRIADLVRFDGGN